MHLDPPRVALDDAEDLRQTQTRTAVTFGGEERFEDAGLHVRGHAEPGIGYFDHHFVVYEYANGTKLFSCCRQQNGCVSDVSDNIMGTKGICHVDTNGPRATIKPVHGGSAIWKSSNRNGSIGDMYVNEHIALIDSIRAGKPINNGDYMTKSTLMAIMGRMATYTGQLITWDQALNSKEDLSPPKYEFGHLPVAQVAKPGVTKFS